MDARAISLHDEALAMRPEGAKHDRNLCPICVDWSMTRDGVPAGFDKLGDEQKSKPFGDVAYADPGLIDGVYRYPLDSVFHIQAAKNFISDEEIAKKYSAEHLHHVNQAIEDAMGSFDVSDSTRKGRTTSLVEEGGKASTMDDKTLTKETHDALLAKAVQDATEKLSAEVSSLNETVATLTAEREEQASKVEELTSTNERLNTELDEAQVKVKDLADENASLKSDIAKRDEEAARAEVASARADQVKALGLFTEEYITERAGRWADVSEEDWAERLEEWKQLRTSTPKTGDEAEMPVDSAMKGSSEGENSPQSARRAVLGLVN